MFKKLIAFSLVVYSIYCHSQNPNASYFYNEGIKAFNSNQFVRADSLYTLSLQFQAHVDTYFNRAMCRLKLNKQKGYNEDLAYAASMGDKEAYAMLRKDFEKADTLRVTTKIVTIDSTLVSFYHVTYSTSKTKEVLDTKFNAKNKLLNTVWYTPPHRY